MARTIACGPQTSLPWTAPVTSSFGPGRKPVKQTVSSAVPMSIVMTDVDQHSGTQAPRQFEQIVAANRHATRRAAHVGTCGMNEQRAAAAGFRNSVVVADRYDDV